jgi:hypothetical protein
LRSAIALWVRSADLTTPLVEWSASLPSVIERGPIPSQDVADAWTESKSEGLIQRLPVKLSEACRLVLASVLATKVTWEDPFAVEQAADHLRVSSAWHGQLSQVMLDFGGSRLTMLAETDCAGLVAVHFAQAHEDLAVLSVAADPDVGRQQVFDAAYELSNKCRNDTLGLAKVSLFDLPLGEGSSWVISEHEVAAYEEGDQRERIEYALLPAWRSESRLDLKASPLFGARPALDAFFGLIGTSPGGDGTVAVQSTVASFTPKGFDAASASLMYLEVGSTGEPTHRGLERRARLHFDHPFAAVALAGSSSDFERARAGHSDLFCLPLFSAWIETPGEPEVADQGVMPRSWVS